MTLDQPQGKPNGVGLLEAIHIAPDARAPMVLVQRALLVAGVGIEGDRYARGIGTFSRNPLDHELTLVEAEVLAEISEQMDTPLVSGETRRNLTTRGVALNSLVGRRFCIGATAVCEGTRLCPPCATLEQITGREDFAKTLANRGGLRAAILVGGEIAEGDSIMAIDGGEA